jgi:tetratricopeptide (TPR) repeat protein
MTRHALPNPVAVVAVVLALCLPAVPAAAQNIQNLPQVSPAAEVAQRVGVADVEISYHRPSVNDRKVWGGLVPYDQVWRAGANDNTTITFSHPVRVEGQALDAGTYGLHMLPSEGGEWQVIFSDVSSAWGSFSYDESEDALRVPVKPREGDFAEQLSYSFHDVTTDQAVVALSWADLEVPFTVAFDTNALALAEIESQLRHIPRFSWQGWSSAAAYLAANDYEHDKALEWIDRSIAMDENGQNLGIKVRLLHQMDRRAEAKEILARALAVSNEAQVNQLGYLFLTSGDPDTAREIFRHNVETHPDSWNTYDSLAEAYAHDGDEAKARELYAKARSMAPETQHQRIDGILEGLDAR